MLYAHTHIRARMIVIEKYTGKVLNSHVTMICFIKKNTFTSLHAGNLGTSTIASLYHQYKYQFPP